MTYLFNKVQGYVALGAGGKIVWGSFRPTASDARQFYEQHNPMQTANIAAVEIKIIENPK